jgi:hypothetical protein
MYYFRLAFICFLLLVPYNSFANTNKSAELKAFLQEYFKNIVENLNANDLTYAKYMSKEYVLHIDGKTFTYPDIVANLKKQKQIMKSVKITFQNLIAEEDKVLSIHIVDAIKKDGTKVKAKVIGLFQIKDKQLVWADELTNILGNNH